MSAGLQPKLIVGNRGQRYGSQNHQLHENEKRKEVARKHCADQANFHEQKDWHEGGVGHAFVMALKCIKQAAHHDRRHHESEERPKTVGHQNDAIGLARSCPRHRFVHRGRGLEPAERYRIPRRSSQSIRLSITAGDWDLANNRAAMAPASGVTKVPSSSGLLSIVVSYMSSKACERSGLKPSMFQLVNIVGIDRVVTPPR